MKLLALIASLLVGSFAIAQEVKLHPDSETPEKTQLQKDIERFNAGILRVAEVTNHAVAKVNAEHEWIWTLPDDRLIALLNADPKRLLVLSSIKDDLGAGMNDALNKLNVRRYTNRAKLGFGRSDVIFNKETRLFEIVPPEEPEPDPEE